MLSKLVQRQKELVEALDNVVRLQHAVATNGVSSIASRGYHAIRFVGGELDGLIEQRRVDVTNELARINAAIDAAEKTAAGWLGKEGIGS